MNNVFKKSYIGNICDINLSTYSLSENWKFVNYLDTGNITKNKIENIQYIDLNIDKLPSRARRKVKQNNIIYSTVRPNQMHYGIIKRKLLENFLVSTGFAVLDVDSTQAEPYFVYYSLIQDDNTTALQAIAEQSTSAYPSIKPSDIKNREILLPPLETQQKIAKVLSAIDDKIELNNSINNNLEQQAQAIFKSWFIDFEPFGGTMPNDWKYVELGKLGLDISDGNYSSKYPKTNEFVSKGVAFIRGTDFIGTFISQNNMYYITEEKHNQLLKGHTKKDDILITTRGDIGRIAFVPNSLINKNINSQLVRINGANIFPKSYLACSLLSKDVQNDFKSLITGSALQQLPVGRLKKILLLKPNKDILNKFDYICKPLFNMSFVNYEENNRLVNLRDTLLPKLMSGEIDVSEVDISTDKLLFIDEVINDKL